MISCKHTVVLVVAVLSILIPRSSVDAIQVEKQSESRRVILRR